MASQATQPVETERGFIPKKAVIGLGVLVVIGTLLYVFLSFDFNAPTVEMQGEEIIPNEYVEAVRSGDYWKAVTANEAIQEDPSISPERKAVSTFASLGTEYRATGDQSARLRDIQKMKEIIRDESLSAVTRANNLNALAGQYSISGRDPAVFAEIYKDAPFSNYLVPGDPDASARKLYEWSYSIAPTTNAAIGIARWHSEQPVFNPTMPDDQLAEHIAKSEEYLQKADAAVVEESRRTRGYEDSTRYLVYKYWRAVVVGRLAVQKGEPYLSMYNTAIGDFISFAEYQKNVLAKEYLLYARLYYGQLLARFEKVAEAKNQLDQLAEELGQVTNPDTNIFIKFVVSEYRNNPSGPNWTNLQNMFSISPNLEVAIRAILPAGE